jgi:uncharacterized protein YecE (DUF72 family)
MAALRIGTCSWKYDSWRGLVYSSKSDINTLQEYAQHYDTVEVDQWFWSLHGLNSVTLPKPDVVRDYAYSVPEDFMFSIKIPNSITLTHLYRKAKYDPLIANPYFLSDELFRRFLDSIQPLRGQLGPLMFQFEYLNKNKMRSQAEFQERFGAFIKTCPDGYTYGVETRNPNYLNDAYFHFLSQNSLQHVFLQGYYMPPIYRIYEKYGSVIREGTVIRLLGPDRKGMEEKSQGKWHRIIAPKDEELDSILDMVENLLSRDIDVTLNVNNHYEGSAPLTIRKIRDRLSHESS